MREGQVLWGWPHCVQDETITQLAIDRRLTLIAWEAMNYWADDGSFGIHVFHKNNELAGYCSTLHAMELMGITGEYGRRLRAAVISFGSTGRGAVTALAAMGIQDISLLTRRQVAAVAAPIHSVRMITFERDPDHPGQTLELDSEHESVAEFLAEHDIIVNCALQDTDAPLIFVMNDELRLFRRGTPLRRRRLRCGHGLRMGAADVLREIRSSRSATASPATGSITARRSCGTRPRGRSARP